MNELQVLLYFSIFFSRGIEVFLSGICTTEPLIEPSHL